MIRMRTGHSHQNNDQVAITQRTGGEISLRLLGCGWASCASSASSSVETAFFTCSGFMCAERNAVTAFSEEKNCLTCSTFCWRRLEALHRSPPQVRRAHYVCRPFC